MIILRVYQIGPFSNLTQRRINKVHWKIVIIAFKSFIAFHRLTQSAHSVTSLSHQLSLAIIGTRDSRMLFFNRQQAWGSKPLPIGRLRKRRLISPVTFCTWLGQKKLSFYLKTFTDCYSECKCNPQSSSLLYKDSTYFSYCKWTYLEPNITSKLLTVWATPLSWTFPKISEYRQAGFMILKHLVPLFVRKTHETYPTDMHLPPACTLNSPSWHIK